MTRVVQLLAAVAVGAAAVFAFTPTSNPVPPPMSAIDVGFAQDMSTHHQQAISMCDMVAPDAAPEIRALADQIRFAQLREIGQMAGWLQLVDAPVASRHPMAWMMAPGPDMADGMAMPGLASPAELVRLQHAKGRENEVLFLQLMTRHHQGGIDMAAYAVRHTGTPAVHDTAVAMVDEQSQEVIFMAYLLSQRHSAPISYP